MEKKKKNMSQITFDCPYCHWSITANMKSLNEHSVIYCYNCNTYLNGNTIITAIQKKESRCRHDKN